MTDPAKEWALVDDETAEARVVTGWCKICYPDGPKGTPECVSARGIVHASIGGDTTMCGKDCTGDKWMFRL